MNDRLLFPLLPLANRLLRPVALLIFGGLFAVAPTMAGTAVPPEFSMSFAPPEMGVGSCTELTLSVENNNPVAVNQLAFNLVLPAAVRLTSPANAINNCGGSLSALDGGTTVSLTNGTVAANTTCTIQVGITMSAPGPFTLTTGPLTSDAGSSGAATATIGIPASGPALGFTKRFSPDLVLLGGTSTLTYTIENQSPEDAGEIAFSETLPPGVVIADSANITTCTSGELTAQPGTREIIFRSLNPDPSLPAGQSCTVSVDVVGISPGVNVSVSRGLTASGPGGGIVSGGQSCAALEVIGPFDLAEISFTKSFLDDPIDPGGTGTLEFTITNNSSTASASNISFTDDLNATLPGLLAVDLPTEGGIIFEGRFGGATSSNVIGGNWDYLDRIQNELGTNQGYPDDADGDEWNSQDFEVATSTIGPWGIGTAPLQAGLIDGFPPGTPELLFGIDAAPDGTSNLITTYLFRHDFTLNAAQLAIDDWILEYLIDDGGIVYVNGVEVFRTPSMPDGPVTTTTLSGLGDEIALASSPVDLTGLLQEGANTIAVEVHQTTLDSSDLGFFLELLPASESSTAGFIYVDDAFEGTVDPDAAAGSVDATGGFEGGGLLVEVGGQTGFFNLFTPASSGAWTRTFTVDTPGTTTIGFRYRLLINSEYEDTEFGQALFELDGIRYGSGPGNSLAQLSGDGNGNGGDFETGWQEASFDLFLSAGEHTIVLGAYNNASSSIEEITSVWFDDVVIGTPETPAPICGPGSSLTGASVLTLAGGSLDPGQSCTFSVEVEVPVSTPRGTYLNTTSRLRTDVVGNALIALPATDTLVVEPIPPAFSKAFSPDSLAAGGTSTLTFTIDNSASRLDATGLAFTDELPAGVVIANPPNASTTCSGGTVSATAGASVIGYGDGLVAAGATCTVTVDVIAATSPGLYPNTSGDLTSSLGNSGPASATLTVVPPPVFTKAFAPDILNAGQVGTLTFTIDNSASPLDASGLSFIDNLPAGLVLSNPANPSTTCIGGIINAGSGNSFISYSGGTVPAGSSCTLTVEVISLEGGTYLNTSGDLTSSLGNSGPATDSLTVQPIVSVTLAKSESSDPVVAGADNLTYVVTATNSGPSTATGVTVSEALTLPAGVSLLSITPSGGTTFSDPTWTIGTLASGFSETLTVVLAIDPSAPAGTNVISDTATLASVNETNFIQGEASVTESTSIVSRVDLEVTKTESADPVIAGSGTGNLTYLVTLRNNGPSTATGVSVSEILNTPAGVSIDSVSASPGTSFTDPTWTVGTLAPGASATLTVVLTVDPTAAIGTDAITNLATVATVDQTELNPANNSASVATSVTRNVDVALTKTESVDPVLAGSGAGNLVYTITATNSGPSDAAGVLIGEALTLPSGVTIDSIAPSTGAYSPANDPNGTWSLQLPAGASETLIVTLTVLPEAPNNGTVSNTASLLEVTGTDTNDDNNTATEETGILAGVDLVVTKTGSVDPVIAGSGIGNLEYLVTVTNNGPLDATGVEISEVLSFGAGIMVDSVTPSAGTFTDPDWTVGTLANGATETLTVILSVGSSAEAGTDAIINIASVTAVDQPQNETGNESATVLTSVERKIDLHVSVAESRDPVLAGFGLPGNLIHSVTVINLGPSDASGLDLGLTQVLPAGATLGSVTPLLGTSFVDPTWTVGDLPSGESAFLRLDLNVPASVPGGIDTISSSGMVSAVNETLLKPGDDSATEATSVVSPASLALSAGAIELDLQTALFKQTITITNNNPNDVPAFRILVNGLPAGVTVHNAQGESGGSSFLLYNQMLAAGASIDLVVEYFQAHVSGGFEPSFEIELLDTVDEETATEGVELDRVLALPNGDILLEFASTIGATYTVQYSHDGKDWFNVVPDIVSGGTRRQWIDNGPPKTPSHPSTMKGRLYRVVPKSDDR